MVCNNKYRGDPLRAWTNKDDDRIKELDEIEMEVRMHNQKLIEKKAGVKACLDA